MSKPTIRPIQPPIQWLLGGSFPTRKASGAWSWPLTCILVPRSITSTSPVSLHGMHRDKI
jgi:hypothetical protein